MLLIDLREIQSMLWKEDTEHMTETIPERQKIVDDSRETPMQIATIPSTCFRVETERQHVWARDVTTLDRTRMSLTSYVQ